MLLLHQQTVQSFDNTPVQNPTTNKLFVSYLKTKENGLTAAHTVYVKPQIQQLNAQHTLYGKPR
jgi:hypothetical protein